MIEESITYGVNHDFFAQESKAGWYILGIAFAKASLQNGRNYIVWKSTSKPLLKKINSILDSNHPISKRDNIHIRKGGPNFIDYRLGISSLKLSKSLRDRGFDVPKEERSFPENVEEQYLDHFVRGIFDAQVTCRNSLHNYGEDNKYARQSQTLTVGQFGTPFIKDFYQMLVQYAGVKGGKSNAEPPLMLYGPDLRKVYEFLYLDWEFIERSGLYLPSKKRAFEVELKVQKPPHNFERHNRAIDLLKAGKSVSEVSEILEFSTPDSFSQNFRRVIGKPPSAFKPKC
jgi:hypothetical protein